MATTSANSANQDFAAHARDEGTKMRRCRPSGGTSARRVLVWLLLAAFALAGVETAAVRQARAGGPEAELAAALKKFDAGRKAYDSGAFEEALLDFQASYSLSASPNSRLFIARCYRALGKVASAYTAFRLASREAQDRLAATHEKRYAPTRDAASGEAAELEPKVPRLTVVAPGGVPDRFAIKQNGEDLPRAAWGVAVETDPGTVTIEASGPRIVAFRKVLTLAEGAEERVDVPVKRVPTAVLTLAMKTRPSGVAIAIDGAPLDLGDTGKPREVDVGEHTVEVDAPGYVSFHWKQSLADGDRRPSTSRSRKSRAGGGGRGEGDLEVAFRRDDGGRCRRSRGGDGARGRCAVDQQLAAGARSARAEPVAQERRRDALHGGECHVRHGGSAGSGGRAPPVHDEVARRCDAQPARRPGVLGSPRHRRCRRDGELLMRSLGFAVVLVAMSPACTFGSARELRHSAVRGVGRAIPGRGSRGELA